MFAYSHNYHLQEVGGYQFDVYILYRLADYFEAIILKYFEILFSKIRNSGTNVKDKKSLWSYILQNWYLRISGTIDYEEGQGVFIIIIKANKQIIYLFTHMFI